MFVLFLSFFFFSLYPPNQTCEMNRCHVSQALSRHAETDRFVDSDIALLPTGCAALSALPLTDPGRRNRFQQVVLSFNMPRPILQNTSVDLGRNKKEVGGVGLFFQHITQSEEELPFRKDGAVTVWNVEVFQLQIPKSFDCIIRSLWGNRSWGGGWGLLIFLLCTS